MIKSNSLEAFKESLCDTSDVNALTEKGDFRRAYHLFCKNNYVQARSDKGISKFMSSLDIYDSKSGDSRYWVGIKVL